MGNISNISLKSLAIMFLFAAIFTYSHYLLIAAGFLGLVTGMLDKNENASKYIWIESKSLFWIIRAQA